MGKSVAPPPTPDYIGAAQQQGAANQQAAITSGHISNPNIITPYGSQTVTWNGEDPTVTQTLNATGQQTVDQQQQSQLGLATTANQQTQRISNLLNTPFNFGGQVQTSLGNTGSVNNQYIDPSQYMSQGSFGNNQNQQQAGGGDQAAIAQLMQQVQNGQRYGPSNSDGGYLAPGSQSPSNSSGNNVGIGQYEQNQQIQQPFGFGGAPQSPLGGNYGNVQGAPDLSSYGQSGYLANGAGGQINQQQIQGGPIGQAPQAGQYGFATAGNIPNGDQFGQAQGANVPAGDAYGLAQGVAGLGPIQTQLNLNGVGRIQNQVGNYGQAVGGPQGPQLQNYINQSNVAQMPINAGTTAQQAIESRLAPQQQRDRTSLETQLTNQGLRPGGEAYNNAMTILGQQQNDAQQQAVLNGLNLDMSANQQGFGQAQTQADFANQAALSQYGAGVTGTQLQNAAQQQNYGQGLSSQQAANAAQGQGFSQALQSGQFGNDAQLASFNAGVQQQFLQNAAIGQNFNQGMQSSQAANQSQNAAIQQNYNQAFQSAQAQQQAKNAAVQQNFNQGLAAQQAQMSAQGQQFNQGIQGQQAQNAAQQQAYNQAANSQQLYNSAIGQNQQSALAQQQAANQAQAQGFGNSQTMLQAQNQANQQNYSNQLTSQQQQNAAQQQMYNQILQSGQFSNAGTAQALAQALQQRQVPINEISALMSGSQIQNPQFQAFQGQTTQAGNIQGAVQQQGAFNQNIYNQQIAQKNALTQGLFSLGGAGLGAICWIAEALYGIQDERTHMVRAYLMGPFRRHWYGRVLMHIYQQHGQEIAKYVPQSKALRSILRPLFDIALKCATAIWGTEFVNA